MQWLAHFRQSFRQGLCTFAAVKVAARTLSNYAQKCCELTIKGLHAAGRKKRKRFRVGLDNFVVH